MLLDKHDRPVLRDMTPDEAWAACEDYQDHAYNIAESLSDDEWDRLICDVSAIYDEYYNLHG
jgi:hypothetical protein